MNVLISLTDCYTRYYNVMLASLYENNKNCKIDIYLYYTDKLSDENINLLKSTIEKNGGRLYSQKISLACFESLPQSIWPKEAFVRLLVFGMLPQSVNRILYLDGDTIINNSIENFYESDFDGNYFIACEDLAILKGDYLANIGFDEGDKYYNAGVLLINVSKLRDDYTKEQVISYICENIAGLKYPDQDVLNILFKGKIKEASAIKYNCITGHYHYRQKDEILKHSAILHFAGGYATR